MEISGWALSLQLLGEAPKKHRPSRPSFNRGLFPPSPRDFSGGVRKRCRAHCFSTDRQIGIVMHVGGLPDVIILLHTELAALIKLRAADRFREALNAGPAARSTITNLRFCPSGLKRLTIIHKFLFRLIFPRFCTVSLD